MSGLARKSGERLGRFGEAGPFDVGRDPLVEIMAHGDLPGLAPLLGELQRLVVAVVSQVLHPEPADGSDPGVGVDERPQDRPVPKPVHIVRLDGGQQLPGLVDGRLGCFALAEGMAHPPDRLKRIEHGRVPGHQDVEEVAQGREGLVLGRCPVGELVQKTAGQAERDLVDLQPLLLAPGEEPAHLVSVGGPGVRVREPRREELIGREAGRLAGAHEDGREGPFEVDFGRRIGGCRDKFLVRHNR